MRNPVYPARSAAVITFVTAALLTTLSGTAAASLASPASPDSPSSPASPASPVSLYAPSALTLTVAEGEHAATSVPRRAAVLSCAPAPAGTHPSPATACAQLHAVNGDIAALNGNARNGGSGKPCLMIYDPVVVTAQGVWEGKRVSLERTFANSCIKLSEGMSVFAF